MIKLYFKKVYLYRLSERHCDEQTQRVITIESTLADFNVKVVYSKPTRKLWEVPTDTCILYVFCLDKRIITHRLFGKPSLGLSPPPLIRDYGNTPVEIITGFKKK